MAILPPDWFVFKTTGTSSWVSLYTSSPESIAEVQAAEEPEVEEPEAEKPKTLSPQVLAALADLNRTYRKKA